MAGEYVICARNSNALLANSRSARSALLLAWTLFQKPQQRRFSVTTIAPLRELLTYIGEKLSNAKDHMRSG